MAWSRRAVFWPGQAWAMRLDRACSFTTASWYRPESCSISCAPAAFRLLWSVKLLEHRGKLRDLNKLSEWDNR